MRVSWGRQANQRTGRLTNSHAAPVALAFRTRHQERKPGGCAVSIQLLDAHGVGVPLTRHLVIQGFFGAACGVEHGSAKGILKSRCRFVAPVVLTAYLHLQGESP